MTRDLRRFARQTNIRLLTGFVFLLFVVGGGLIYIIYGPGAALMGVVCLLAALLPVLLIIMALFLIELFVRRSNR